MGLKQLSRRNVPELPSGFESLAFDPCLISPGIVHIGLGGFHRAHMARYLHDLMGKDEGALIWGIVGAGLRPSDKPLLEILDGQDGLYSLVEREGARENRALVASLIGTIDASDSSIDLLAAIDKPETRIVSMTVTENGYHLNRATKSLDLDSPAIRGDLEQPNAPRTLPGILVEAFRRRKEAGAPAFTALCCDNIQHNGNVVKAAVIALANKRDSALAAWIDVHASFPNSMVDRITPVPTVSEVEAFKRQTSLDDGASLTAELFRQWVIEDRFVAGRPAWEKVGVHFVEDVTPYEFMKLRLLNGSHLAIAAVGQVQGYALIGETIADPLIRRYMTALMDRETGPTLPEVPGIDISQYKRKLIDRFANPAIRDTTQRVNTDAPINILVDPIRDRLASGEPIDLLALGLAAWFRRLSGFDDAGQPIKLVHPLADTLTARAREGGTDPAALLSIEPLFGELGSDDRLKSVVGEWLASIYRFGMAETLAKAAARGLF